MSQSVSEKAGKLSLRRHFRAVVNRLRGGELSPRRLAASVALGLFVGTTPLYGFHSIIVLALATPLRLDSLIAYLASNISLPPMIPVLLFAEAQVGAFLIEGRWLDLTVQQVDLESILHLSASIVVGTLVVATLIAAVGGSFTWFLANLWAKRQARLSSTQAD